MKKLFAVVLIILFVCLTLMPMAVGKTKDGTLYNKKRLQITTRTDKPEYIVGDVVTMTLSIDQLHKCNRYTFPTAQRYDFELYKNDTLIWRWSWGRMFAQVFGYITLYKKSPLLVYTETWDSTGAEPGVYDLKGIWTCIEPVDHPYDWVQFELAE